MIRFLLLLCILLAGEEAFCQGHEIKKSADVVVIKGKSYYLHVVEEGQTLYSICKAYGADVETVKGLNGKQDNALSMFDVLKIPYVEPQVTPYVERDKKYYYHKVEKGETLYSISRRFQIDVKQILKENEQYTNSPMPIAAIVKLPLNKIDEKSIGVPHVEPVIEKKKEINEAPPIAEPWETKKTPGTDVTTNTVSGAVYADSVLTAHPLTPENKYVKVAVVLPFYSQENMSINQMISVADTSMVGKPGQKRLLKKSEQFLYFYEGILLAVDSLKNDGYKIDLHVYDSDKSEGKMHQIVAELNQLNPDIIIGPVYASEFKVMADGLTNKNIPMVYPLSFKSEDFCKYPNFLQVNISSRTLAEEMAQWVLNRRDSANIINLTFGKNGDAGETSITDLVEKGVFYNKLHTAPGVNFYNWNFQGEPLEAMRLLLKEGRENIVIIPTSKEAEVSKILPVLSSLTDHYRITVIGFPDWQNFTSVDHETFYKLNVKLFTYSYIDNYQESARNFADMYRKYFHTEPHTLANKAYDIALYFIPLAAQYGTHLGRDIPALGKEGIFSIFRFSTMCPSGGKENRGLYIVNYGADYKIKIKPLK